MGFGSQLLATDDVMPSVDRLMPIVQIADMFPDGAKLVTQNTSGRRLNTADEMAASAPHRASQVHRKQAAEVFACEPATIGGEITQSANS